MLVLLNVWGNISLRQDHALETEVQDQHGSIESYATNNKKLPDIIADAGVTDTKGVDYKKISNNRYMLCANFKTKSDGYTSTPEPDYIQNGSNLEVSANTKFSNGDSNGIAHDKGYTCIYYQSYSVSQPITVKPSPASPTTGVTSIPVRCGSSTEKFPYRLSATVSSVDTSASQINLDSTGQYLYNGNGNTYLSPNAIDKSYIPQANVSYTAFTAFYDTSCKQITAADIQPGNYLYIYKTSATSADTATSWVEVFATSSSTAPCPASGGACIYTQ